MLIMRNSACYNRGFIMCWALGKLTSCEGYFSSGGLTIQGKIFVIKKVSSKRYAHPTKVVALLLKMLLKPLLQ